MRESTCLQEAGLIIIWMFNLISYVCVYTVESLVSSDNFVVWMNSKMSIISKNKHLFDLQN